MKYELPVLDNHDHRIKYYELLLKRDNLDNIPEYKLPDGYKFIFYKSGDRDEWIEIEKSAKEFDSYEQGLESWNRYYEGKDDELVTRMCLSKMKTVRRLQLLLLSMIFMVGTSQVRDGFIG